MSTAPVITSEQLLEHWQGHRRLTRRLIDAFQEDQLFTFSIGGMRTFGDLSLELLTMGAPMLKGVVTSDWGWVERKPQPKAELLRLWDEATEEINTLWPQVPAERFQETMT